MMETGRRAVVCRGWLSGVIHRGGGGEVSRVPDIVDQADALRAQQREHQPGQQRDRSPGAQAFGPGRRYPAVRVRWTPTRRLNERGYQDAKVRPPLHVVSLSSVMQQNCVTEVV